MKFIDYYLNRITMYQLVLWELRILIGIAMALGFFHLLPYSPYALLVSVALLVGISWVTQKIFAFVFAAPTNGESVYITALILSLIITPIRSIHDLPFFFWIAVWSVASKFIFAIKKKHIFNPAAIAAVLCAVVLGQSATWWIGNAYLMPFVLFSGLLLVRKIQRENLVFSFFCTVAILVFGFSVYSKGNIYTSVNNLVFHSSLLFFGFIMLTEPLTTPPTKKLQIAYGVLVGFLFMPQIHIGPIFSTPELALVVGNVFSYIISPKQKLMLTLKQKIQQGSMVDFIFSTPKNFSFTPGQYMEWTLPHKNPDFRGSRRYFTIASSPTESQIHLGVRIATQNGSSYKKALMQMNDQTQIVGAQLAGDFVLPKDLAQPCVLIAGGIGITPFRSMVQYALDTKQRRDIVLFYSNKIVDDILYKDIFNAAQQQGIRVVYTLTDTTAIPVSWKGERGRIDSSMIQKYVPKYKTCRYYLSGPRDMVLGFEATLKGMGILTRNIKKDFFPGFV